MAAGFHSIHPIFRDREIYFCWWPLLGVCLIVNLHCKLNPFNIFQACPHSQGGSGSRDLRSVCCHSCKLQIFPVKQATKVTNGHALLEAPDHFDAALNQPPYMQEQGRRLVEAAAKTHSKVISQGASHADNSALLRRDHMRAYLGSYLLTGDQ